MGGHEGAKTMFFLHFECVQQQKGKKAPGRGIKGSFVNRSQLEKKRLQD